MDAVLNFMDRINHPYFTDIDEFMEAVKAGSLKTVRNRDKIEYYNIPCSFDIETTSFFENEEGEQISPKQWAALEAGKRKYTKKACMYIWMFGLNGYVIIGRTWLSLHQLLLRIQNELSLYEDRRLLCYVHNLSFEFQWIKNLMTWTKIFATKPYEPLYALSDYGIEFRCSYRLTGKSLAKLSEGLNKYKVAKMVGDLDYDLLRHSDTPLSDKEMVYCINDVKVVMCHIQEQIEIEKRILYIPLTKTGYVRRHLKNACFKDKKNPKKSKTKRFRYAEMMKGMTLDPDIYYMALDALQGGFTHANAIYVDELLHGVTSLDISSSYPCIMVAEMFPMSTPKERKIGSKEELERYLRTYCCLFTIEFEDIENMFIHDNYIARARCDICEDAIVDNGRIKKAKRIRTTITEQDYFIIRKMYKWKRCRIHKFYTSYKGYLPKPIIETILKLYSDKTTLKGIEGKEIEYMLSKELLNSCFGCMITSIYHPDIILDENGKWYTDNSSKSIDDVLKDYNTKSSRFLYFLWGVWVTAYGRRNIMSSIFECKGDHVYSDTDSDKILNFDKHAAFYERYNKRMIERLERCLNFYKLDLSLIRPRNAKGEEKLLGIFENEGTYEKFKTLGAKRYMVDHHGQIEITVAGLSKKDGRDYILREYGDPFEAFRNGLHVDALNTGKLTHTYIDDAVSGYLTDYMGNKGRYAEKSMVHLSPCDFSVTLTDDYVKFVNAFKYACYDLNFLK